MAKKSAIPLRTAEELQYVKQSIMLPIVLDVLERDIHMLDTVPLKMPAIYIQMLRGVQQLATIDLAKLRRELRIRGIKIYEQRRTTIGIEAAYLCRGYHHHFSMIWDVVRAEVEEALQAYLKIHIANKDEGR